MTSPNYRLQDDPRPKLGLIALQVDETIEDDLRRLLPRDQARLHITRIPSGADLTPDTIATMKTALPAAAGLLPPAVEFDVVGYGCTSGTVLIGADHVASLVQVTARTNAVTDPLTATIDACRTLGLTRLGILSPYIDSVAGPIRRAFETNGIDVPATLSFGEEVESRVARIAPASLDAAARQLADRASLQGLFLSCTNLRTLDILPGLERDLGLPVLSSNLCLAWHMARTAGIRTAANFPSRLLQGQGV